MKGIIVELVSRTAFSNEAAWNVCGPLGEGPLILMESELGDIVTPTTDTDSEQQATA